jgi:hypothetical protein
MMKKLNFKGQNQHLSVELVKKGKINPGVAQSQNCTYVCNGKHVSLRKHTMLCSFLKKFLEQITIKLGVIFFQDSKISSTQTNESKYSPETLLYQYYGPR